MTFKRPKKPTKVGCLDGCPQKVRINGLGSVCYNPSFFSPSFIGNGAITNQNPLILWICNPSPFPSKREKIGTSVLDPSSRAPQRCFFIPSANACQRKPLKSSCRCFLKLRFQPIRSKGLKWGVHTVGASWKKYHHVGGIYPINIHYIYIYTYTYTVGLIIKDTIPGQDGPWADCCKWSEKGYV